MKIALLQLNYIIGDLEYNFAKIAEGIEKCKGESDLVLLSEMSISGYPPMDLLEKRKFISDNIEYACKVAALATGVCVVFGFIDQGKRGELYNAAAVAFDGKIQNVIHKTLLPTYDVFDEHRYFRPAESCMTVDYKGTKLGVTICEDIWNADVEQRSDTYTDFRFYDRDPVAELVEQGAEIILNLSASPFVASKAKYRFDLARGIAKKYSVPLLYCNQVGGNDSLIFDGASFAVSPGGNITALAAKFEEDIVVADTQNYFPAEIADGPMADLEGALVLGLKDYLYKCGFKSAVVGLSGGIDSALTAALAVKALGAENVRGITMPSTFSSEGSVNDSYDLAKNLGITIDTIPIQPIFQSFNDSLAGVFTGREWDVTEENLQARIRGSLLMAASNKFGSLLLTTGNKSELAMGYCTLYGDMNGGLAVISDLPKTVVYELSRYLNRDGVLIPEDTLTKPPSAELREGQKDEDSLPPYDILDGILAEYIENKKSRKEIVTQGYDSETVDFVVRNVDRNEYKRRQAAPGLKVTSKAFGSGRRIPMAQRFKS